MMLTNLAIVVALAMLESGMKADAINVKEQAYGWHQIRQPALDDVRRHYDYRVKLQDCLDPQVSSTVMYLYCTLYGARTPEQFADVLRAGPGGKAPKEYVLRLRNIMTTLEEPGRSGIPEIK